MTLKEQIAVLEHLDNGGEVCLDIDNIDGKKHFFVSEGHLFNFEKYKYLIVPQKTWQDELKEICRSGYLEVLSSGSIIKWQKIDLSDKEECLYTHRWLSFNEVKKQLKYTPKPEWLEG